MPRGFNSLAVKAHHQPQASLAGRIVRSVVKRRQRVLKPCDGAPRLFLAGAFVVLGTGAAPKQRRRNLIDREGRASYYRLPVSCVARWAPDGRVRAT
jgi:hypothetical protein